MINTLFLWTTIIIMALLIETGAPGLFYFLSLAIGSAAAAFLSYLNFDFTAQLATCLLVSCSTVALLRYLVTRDTTSTHLATNIEGLIGQKTAVTEKITSSTPGLVKIYGDIWLAREQNGQEIPVGQEVTVVDVQGCHLIVKK